MSTDKCPHGIGLAETTSARLKASGEMDVTFEGQPVYDDGRETGQGAGSSAGAARRMGAKIVRADSARMASQKAGPIMRDAVRRFHPTRRKTIWTTATSSFSSS